MPLIRIQTNIAVENSGDLSQELTILASEWLEKPRKFIMIQFMPEINMTMAGTNDPCAYIEFTSISLTGNQIKTISKELTRFINKSLNVKCDRVYIDFKNAKADHWSWNGATFN